MSVAPIPASFSSSIEGLSKVHYRCRNIPRSKRVVIQVLLDFQFSTQISANAFEKRVNEQMGSLALLRSYEWPEGAEFVVGYADRLSVIIPKKTTSTVEALMGRIEAVFSQASLPSVAVPAVPFKRENNAGISRYVNMSTGEVQVFKF